MTMKLDMVQTAALAVIVLFIGQRIKDRVPFLEKYCIPSPVVGGLLFAILFLLLKVKGIVTISFDPTLQNLFMNIFFTTIGFTASLKLLKKSGIAVLTFLGISIVLIFFQNITGVFLAKEFKLNELLGLATGSVPLVGGVGTSGAFGPLLEKAGADGATTVAIASATFGMIMGSIIGGPIAKSLIEKNMLLEDYKVQDIKQYKDSAASKEVNEINPDNFTIAISQIFLAMGIGTVVSYFFEKFGLTFPPYIGAMFSAALIRNLSDFSDSFRVRETEIEVVGNVSLSLFLSMALMGLKLWQLVNLAIPMVAMLIAQTLIMVIFAYIITFNIMGRDYEAAVMTAGQCGFGMGATPNAMANMSALTERYGPAPKAFFVIPLVGSLFIDFFNAVIIVSFINFLK